MRIAITGASGHVGANLSRMLLEKNMDLRLLVHRQRKAIEGLDVEIVQGDLEKPETLEPFCKDVDVIIHLAAKISIGNNSFASLKEVNFDGTENLVNAAKKAGVKRFIHFSTIHAFEHAPLDEEMDESRPMIKASHIPYEMTKSMADEWVLQQQSDDFDVIILNPTAIIGPFDFQPSLQGAFIIRLYKGALPGLVPGGYDWVDVRDVAGAARAAITKGKPGERYFLSGHYASVVDFANILSEVSGKRIKKTVLPLWLAYMGVPFIRLWSKMRDQEPLYTQQSLSILQSGNKKISNKKAGKDLGFNPRPLSDTLKDTLDWFMENNYI
ncbi:MAG: NAD-dependent epimerase/dehydratase family protein [Chlorobi bacterium]|nr:NAD-dependent epimerase/dehydratase family protein [Chlorobiota bacterium]